MPRRRSSLVSSSSASFSLSRSLSSGYSKITKRGLLYYLEKLRRAGYKLTALRRRRRSIEDIKILIERREFITLAQQGELAL